MRTHERRDHWIPKRVGTVVVVGTAVTTRSVRFWLLRDWRKRRSLKALNKLFDQANSTADMAIVIHCGVVNLKICSVIY